MRHLLVVPVALTAIAGAPPFREARGDVSESKKQDCAAIAEGAQALRSEAHLLEARRRFVLCTRSSCPALIQRDCARWADEIEALVPTVSVRAREVRGRDVVGVEVTFDGVVQLRHLTGTAFAADPGPHHVRYTTSGGASVEEDILLVEGERQRLLTVTFPVALRSDGTPDAAPPPNRPLSAPTPAPSDDGAGRPRSSPLPWIAGGVAAAAAAGFGYFQVSAWSDYRGLRDTCGTTRSCSSENIDDVRRKLIVGDVALGVAVIAVGVAAWSLFLAHAPK